jgi:hypothetical protein
MKRAMLLAMVAASLTVASGAVYAEPPNPCVTVRRGAPNLAEPPSPCVLSRLQLLRLLPMVLPIA